MSTRKIEALIDETNADSILILCHQNADPDAICSAFAFSQLLKHLKPKVKVEIASPEGISRLSEILADHLHVEIKSVEPDFKEADIIVMVDTNTTKQLGKWDTYMNESSAPLVVVDHHAGHPETEKIAALCISDENSSSTCEIVYSLFKESGLTPSLREAEALFLGIAFDTRHFILANSTTFKAIADLVDTGFNTREVLSLMSLPMELSERIARLKACRRVKLVRISNWLIAFSQVGSYQASAAKSLIELGAHLALVGGQRKDAIQISIRADREFYTRTGFHLGRDLAKPLGDYLHGMGGGHSTAAGINGTGDFETAAKQAIKILKEKLVESHQPDAKNQVHHEI
jgi:nanoRNase/pAp phosphatase (c-di-AMP/oligoRNAs hydrolase)